MMTQNIFDNAEFFAGYSALPRSIDGLAGAPEWPALRALLPAMEGLRILDLGCGFGWFSRWAKAQGAAHVLGIDVSERMLARARAESPRNTIAYLRADLERVELPRAAFELAYSALAFHYIEDLPRLLAKVWAALVPGAKLVFSVEHPVYTAPSRPDWSSLADGRKIWPLDSYLIEGPRVTDWLAKGVVKQHRTLGTYLNLLVGTGFTLARVEEWGPTDGQIAARPEWQDERQRPIFLLVSAQR